MQSDVNSSKLNALRTKKKYVKYAAKEHETSEKLIASVKKGLASTAKNLLCERNKGAEERKPSHTVVLMDATGSMQHLLQKAKNAVCTMFDRISTILKDKELPPDCFEMQFMVYRNYNASEDMILQASPWESKPDNLRKFMETVRADYGLGNEAIEIGLACVNTEAGKEDVSQVILIGDMPPNKRQEVDKKRQIKGEHCWKGTKFSIPTYYKKELDLLKQSNITVHAFYVGEKAKRHFEAIARTSGGKCAELQINSDQGSEQLIDIVSTTILKHAGRSREPNLLRNYMFDDYFRASERSSILKRFESKWSITWIKLICFQIQAIKFNYYKQSKFSYHFKHLKTKNSYSNFYFFSSQ
ncbi:hypothetical protein RFI_25649 [Reticulomyxa filosa]|uniref:VWFA domain-containing protein n=1 Tax=Reticulomyxa filosa TaxID=46433 RepID=X6ME64_RETFI|nr:hypothetical protein RFI_25649 [Reticulomyxa filosa]|eukprot:ETO11722.1 hypothetical protein RFI_25649 [Reticulomyxa filosa]